MPSYDGPSQSGKCVRFTFFFLTSCDGHFLSALRHANHSKSCEPICILPFHVPLAVEHPSFSQSGGFIGLRRSLLGFSEFFLKLSGNGSRSLSWQVNYIGFSLFVERYSRKLLTHVKFPLFPLSSDCCSRGKTHQLSFPLLPPRLCPGVLGCVDIPVDWLLGFSFLDRS